MKIHIEYCEKWNYHPEFERVSNIINKHYPNAIVEGNNSLPRTGSFEVTTNGLLKYSKLQTNQFPLEDEILSWFKNNI